MGYSYSPSSTTSKDRMNLSTWSLQVDHGLNNVIGLFANTFLVSYITQVSASESLSASIVSVASYYLAIYIVMIFLNTLLGYLVDRTNRVWLYRVGIICKGAFIVLVIFMGQNLAKYSVLAGALYGVAESFYYSSFNILKSEMVPRAHADKYVVVENIFAKVINVAFPIILGVLIDVSTYVTTAYMVLAVVAIQVVFSCFIKSSRPEGSCFEFFKYLKKLKGNSEDIKRIKNFYPVALAYGGTKIQTALVPLLAIYTFKTNISLGLFTALFAFLAVACLFLFKYLKKSKIGEKASKVMYIILGILPVIVSVMIAISIEKWSFIVFSMVLEIAICLLGYSLDVQRTVILKKTGHYEDIAEHQALTEVAFNIIRAVTFVLMLVLGLTLDINGLKICIAVVSLSYPLLALFLMRLEKEEKKYPIDYVVVSVEEVTDSQNATIEENKDEN